MQWLCNVIFESVMDILFCLLRYTYIHYPPHPTHHQCRRSEPTPFFFFPGSWLELYAILVLEFPSGQATYVLVSKLGVPVHDYKASSAERERVVRACVRACVCVGTCVCGWVGTCVWVGGWAHVFVGGHMCMWAHCVCVEFDW